MKKTNQLFYITAISATILFCLHLLWNAVFSAPGQPLPENGLLDLRDWNVAANRPIALNGEWEFYPYQLITSTAGFDKAEADGNVKMEISVPEVWDSYFPHPSDDGFYYGTYRLRMLLHEEQAQPDGFGLYLQDNRLASEVYVNGRRVGGSGVPSDDKEIFQPQLGSYIASFELPDTESYIDLAIIVSGTDEVRRNGIVRPIKFGDKSAIYNERELNVNMQLLLCIVTSVFGIFAIILYGFDPRQMALLTFLLLIASTTVSVLITDDQLLNLWFPIPLEWGTKIYTLSYIGIALSILLISRYFVPQFTKLLRLLGLVYTAIALFYLLAPVEYLLFMPLLRVVLITFSYLLLPFLFYKTAKNGQKDIVYLLLAATSVASSSLWGISKAYFLSTDTIFYPFDMMIAFFALAAFWFKRYYRNADELTALTRKLQLEDKQKDAFLANTSHELRNPLHGMINIAQSVLDNNRHTLESGDQKNLELMITVGQRMSLLLNDLLDVSRLKENLIRLNTAPLRIQSVISGVIDMLRFLTEGKPVQIISTVPDTFPALKADENRVIQILFNLIHNAIKFTPVGNITVHADISGEMARIRVKDTGIGIDRDELEKILLPYEQGEPGIAISSGGFGLGLSICRHLIELHGGTLHVESTPGQGSVFTFTLPLAEVQAKGMPTAFAAKQADIPEHNVPTIAHRSIGNPAASKEAADANMNPNRPKLLVVDDDPVNLKIVETVLASESYHIVTAVSGQEALDKLNQHRWHLIISDVMMPGLSGYELTRLIRRQFSVSELPVLLLTARSRPEDIASGFLSGANDYVTKPVNALELKSRARALIQFRQSVESHVRMEAAWLQAQIQPHFLFNTLNTIGALGDIDTNKMRLLLEAFGTYLRTSFDFRNLDPLVPLAHELDLVESYLYIQKERFEERLQVVWEKDQNIQIKVPPLSIQTIVENALIHGILKRSRAGTVRIRIADIGRFTEISISDDGVGMTAEQIRHIFEASPDDLHGIGLRNTNRRLKQLFGEGLRIESVPGEGTRVSFNIPK